LELPTIAERNLLAFCEETTNINMCDNPKSCDSDGSAFSMKDFLVPILGNSFALKEFSEGTEEEQKQLTKYCNLLNWYLALRRVGYICILHLLLIYTTSENENEITRQLFIIF
jgi:hypothetical protein